MGVTKYDYDTLEREFVQGSLSIRKLAERHGIKAWSTVNEYAKRHDWDLKRAKFQERVAERETAVVVMDRMKRLERALDDSVLIANRAMHAFLDSLEDRWVKGPEGQSIFVPGQVVTADQFVKIVDKILLLSGKPTVHEAHVGVQLDLSDPSHITTEMLRDIAEWARSQGGSTAGSGGSSPFPRIEDARQVN